MCQDAVRCACVCVTGCGVRACVYVRVWVCMCQGVCMYACRSGSVCSLTIAQHTHTDKSVTIVHTSNIQ